MSVEQLLFLPGAGGSALFWQPVADQLSANWRTRRVNWPGLGNEPPVASVRSMSDLVQLCLEEISGPTCVIAQSMGGIVAARLALAEPALVRKLVLVCCSAGVDMQAFGARDWRPAYIEEYPSAETWILDPSAAPAIPFERIEIPTLLVWGESDPFSPVEVGRNLQQRIRSATLRVMPGGGHYIAQSHPDLLAKLIKDHVGPVE